MSQVSSISGLGKTSSELLEAVGFADLHSLAHANVEDLYRELKSANEILKIAKRNPHKADVAKWIKTARSLAGVVEPALVPEEAPEPAGPPAAEVNYEALAEVRGMLLKAPIAVPLSATELMLHDIRVGDIPPAILLNSVAGDLNIRTTATPVMGRTARPQTQSYVQLAEGASVRKVLDISKIRSVEDVRMDGKSLPVVPAMVTDPVPDRVALLRAPRAETNRGRDPQSRKYIRGVLHSQPIWIALTALVTLCCSILVPLGIIGGILLLLSDQMPKQFSWVPVWFLVFPLSLPVFGGLYAILATGARCRICGQRLFVPKQCLKNSKSHHVKGLGYIIPLSVHILLFRWFRCTFCGTPVRLKE